MAKSDMSSMAGNAFCQDMVDLQQGAVQVSAVRGFSSPAQVMNEAKLARLEAFAEKPLSQERPGGLGSGAGSDGHPDAEGAAPSDFYDWLLLSYSRMREGDVEGAWEAACKTLDYDNPEPDLYVPLCQQFDTEKRRHLAHSAMKKTSPGQDAYQWLWLEVALSYWYEGNFQEACKEYETIISQKFLDPCLVPILYNSLAMCYEALGRYQEAEEKYLDIDNREAVIKARARSGDLEGALLLMKKGMGVSEPSVNAAMEATWQCCLGCSKDDLDSRICDLLELEADWPYKDFMLGVMELVNSGGAVGYARLDRFLRICAASPHEWAITLRWEIGVVNSLLGQ